MRLTSVETTALLLACGADPNKKDQDGQTPLHHATIFGNFTQVKFLANHGAELEVKDDHQRTPLHYAAVYKRVQIAGHLLSEGVQINTRDKLQQTPLLLACRVSSYELT